MTHQPIIIIGGGIAGLSTAWHLVQKKIPVILFEQGQVGEKASMAAAGMLTPTFEAQFGEESLVQLFIESMNYYRDFIPLVERTSQIKTDFHQSGALLVAVDKDDEAELMRTFEFQKNLELPVSLLSSTQLIEEEPLINPHCQAAIKVSHECFVDNMLLNKALHRALLEAHVPIYENQRVEQILVEDHTVTGVVAGNQTFRTNKVLLACGVDQSIKGLPQVFSIRPVKGQALELKSTKPMPFKQVIRSIHRFAAYCVPRCDGRITVGATSEDMGLDAQVTAGAMMDLLYATWKIIPSIYDMEFVAGWAGHRPAARDNAPIIGQTTTSGLYTALGYYRHGILLGPYLGHLLANLIADQQPSPYFDLFGPHRFS